MRRLFLRTLLLLVLTSGAALAQKRGDRSLITRTDLDEGGSGLTTAQEAIQRLRPNWLRPPMGRNATAGMLDGLGDREATAREAILYIDEVRQPNLEQLRTVQLSRVVEMKYLDQNRAVQLLGPGHEAGAILITTMNKR
ncbi:MAG TPA: hypothetical protein PKC83_02500 [Gemmatimonadaceae bacterium]|jgi:hypothetical protein|nr:MAG: hypothetical protein ABS52_00700 [Gemmatimonadetes bacterium SCN 70-22]HMN07630.1 hypothetical protein [Gemmatimonadaceae bacterium]